MKSSHGLDCRTARSRMSEALDQRLSRTRIRGFQQHILSCPDCRKQFDELRKLSELSGRLPSNPISPSFGRRLQERIAAGEGTPPAVFDGPLTRIKQTRIFFSGMLTAAAALFGFYLLLEGLAEEPRDPDSGFASILPGLQSGKLKPVEGEGSPVIQPHQFETYGKVAYRNAYRYLDDWKQQAPKILGSEIPEMVVREFEDRVRKIQENLMFFQFMDGNPDFRLSRDLYRYIQEAMRKVEEINIQVGGLHRRHSSGLSESLKNRMLRSLRQLHIPRPGELRFIPLQHRGVFVQIVPSGLPRDRDGKDR